MPVDPNATIEISAFAWVPPFAEGLVRDLRVRWALEEAGLAYRERLLDATTARPDDYFLEQPFGQVPIYNEGEIRMFETGAIVLHIAERTEALMPRDPDGRARTASWVVASLNSIVPMINELVGIDFFNAEAEWAKARRPGAEQKVRDRLAARPSRRPFHGGRPDDDDDAAHPAPHRSRRRASEPRRVPGPLRGKAGVRARASSAARAVQEAGPRQG